MLASLDIKNFRLLEDFQVGKLGRVNLIVGRNNSGKSSVLEALRIYASNAQRGVLEMIALEHNERLYLREDRSEDPDSPLPFEEFFFGRTLKTAGENKILIGQSASHPDVLTLEYGFLLETRTEVRNVDGGISTQTQTRFLSRLEPFLPDEGAVTQCLRVTKREQSKYIRLERLHSNLPYRIRTPEPASGALPLSIIPTQFVSLDELADEWDKIALTDSEDIIREALQIIEPEFRGITFVRNDTYVRGDTRARFQRTAQVKLASYKRPVPLNSLGDGMLRVLQLALKVFPARGGLYLIDEFENGLHFSVQEKVWSLLFRLAENLDIQIFATTHSWDCIESFARVARDVEDVEGLLFRVGRSVRISDRNRVIATVFDEEQLHNITQADVEVR